MIFRIAAFAGVAIWAVSATAGPGTPGHTHEHAGAAHGATGTDGGPGKAAETHRTIRIEARDTAFNVKQIQVHVGETIRFVITNKGQIRHEFSIASPAEHAEHREMMQQMPDMVHEDPNVVTIEPGETKELVWKFGKDRDVQFACDIPGHSEQGMVGTFRVAQ